MSLARVPQVLRPAICQSSRLIATTSIQNKEASDPVQQLFLDKIRQYAQKQKAAGGKMVDATADVSTSLNKQLSNVANQFHMKAPEEAFKFPQLNFKDPALDPVNVDIVNNVLKN